MKPVYDATLSLHDARGQRKYLNQQERLRFLECTRNHPIQTRLFCQMLYYTGARIAEIHNLNTGSIDFENKAVVIRTLKKRKQGVYREIPLPDELLEFLGLYIDHLKTQPDFNKAMWKFSLRSASRHVKSVMHEAGISGVRSCARGLRHGFAVHAVNIAPINLVKKWLGHASLETTSIYLNVIGAEERLIAQRVWEGRW